jgi:transcriptional regulator with XRE-family HTH domain
VATRRRPADIGAERGRTLLAQLVREETAARRDRGLALADVAGAIGVSGSTASRIEAGRSADLGLIRLSSMLAVVGLDLSARAYPGGSPLRDAGHVALLARFRSCLHRSLVWSTETPLPHPGDLRAWDGLVRGPGWRYGAEAETHPTDGQGIARRLQLKARDGDVDGVILVLPSTRHTRSFLAAAGDLLAPAFPVPGPRALELLRAGVDPGGSAIVVL